MANHHEFWIPQQADIPGIFCLGTLPQPPPFKTLANRQIDSPLHLYLQSEYQWGWVTMT